ncbi:MAG: extracellular solute-binding protein [Caldilineaceae bacterium]
MRISADERSASESPDASDSTNVVISRRTLLKWIAAGAGSCSLASCLPSSASQSTQTLGESTPTIEYKQLHVLVCCYTEPETTLREQFNKQYSATRSGLTIDMEMLAEGQNYFEKLQTHIAAGTMPDLYDLWEGYVQPYAKSGALLNLDPYLENDSEVKKSELLPPAIEAAAWQDNLYALLIGFMPGPASVYYNLDHLSEVGIAEPNADWRWDDLRAMAQALVKRKDESTERYGLAFDLWFVPWTYWIWSNGGDILNPEQTKAILDQPQSIEALQYWANLVNVDQIAVPTDQIRKLEGGINAFKSGVTSLYLGNTWDVASLKQSSDLHWKAVLSPRANIGSRTWYEHSWCWGISTQSKEPDLAWDYARNFVLNRVIDPATPTIPPLKKLLDRFNTESNQKLGYAPLIALASQPNQFRIPAAGEKWAAISSIIQSELDLVFTGEKSAATAAETISPLIDEALVSAT